MTEEQQTGALWERLERWLHAHLPQALAALPRPAQDHDITAVEAATGLAFPPALRASYLRHDGGPGIFPDGQQLLSLAALRERWGRRQPAPTAAPDHEQPGAELVGEQVVQGPVRTLAGSRRWLPLMALGDTTTRYLDFDPPDGGAPGQVIEVDLEQRSWRALAPSFLAFFDRYVEDLERGRYVVAGGLLQARREETPQIGGEWDMPEYLGRRA